VIIFLLSLIVLFLVLASWLKKIVHVLDLSLHYCKFVCFVMCDKNLGALLILCSMFVNLSF
jgi:hypothetical protein